MNRTQFFFYNAFYFFLQIEHDLNQNYNIKILALNQTKRTNTFPKNQIQCSSVLNVSFKCRHHLSVQIDYDAMTSFHLFRSHIRVRSHATLRLRHPNVYKKFQLKIPMACLQLDRLTRMTKALAALPRFKYGLQKISLCVSYIIRATGEQESISMHYK